MSAIGSRRVPPKTRLRRFVISICSRAYFIIIIRGTRSTYYNQPFETLQSGAAGGRARVHDRVPYGTRASFVRLRTIPSDVFAVDEERPCVAQQHPRILISDDVKCRRYCRRSSSGEGKRTVRNRKMPETSVFKRAARVLTFPFFDSFFTIDLTSFFIFPFVAYSKASLKTIQKRISDGIIDTGDTRLGDLSSLSRRFRKHGI